MNWQSYNTALRQRGSLTLWIDPDMQWEAEPSGKRGRQQRYSDASIQACLTLKVLFRLPLRQTTGFVESLLKLAGLDWPVPDYTTLCRRQKDIEVMIPYRASSEPLHLLIDSTGIKAEGDGQWRSRRQGRRAKRRQWRKVHLGVDEKTLQVRAVEITGAGVGDAPMLPELLSQIPPEQAIARRKADPVRTFTWTDGVHTLTPPRKNAKLWKPTSPGAVARNEALRACKRLGRAIWKKWSGYHRRSRVETKMNCLKLLGQGLMARTFERQVAEIQARIVILNKFTALGTPKTVAVKP